MTATGIKWPLQLYAGRVAISSGIDHIRESISQIIAIGRGEYLMKPDFGCDINLRVFDPVNAAAMLDGDIREALDAFETRVRVDSVSTDMDRANEGVIGVVVGFTVTGTDQANNVQLAMSSAGLAGSGSGQVSFLSVGIEGGV